MEKKCETCRYGGADNCSHTQNRRFWDCSSRYSLWQPKEDTVQEYRVIKTINADTLLAKKPCVEEYAACIQWFGYAAPPDVSFLKWVMGRAKASSDLAWLIEKGFIEKVEPELKPCPFCGCGAEEQDGWSGLYIQCKKCFATAGKEAWNRRA